jgi:hypothetical protein
MKRRSQKTELDRIGERLRIILARETENIVAAGGLMVEARDHLERGQWMPWIENFGVSHDTALNYIAAAHFAIKHLATESDNTELRTVRIKAARFVAPTILYDLANDKYTEEDTAAIVAAIRECRERIDIKRADAICEALLAAELAAEEAAEDAAEDEAEDAPEPEDGSAPDDGAADFDPNVILDGEPPVLPPTAPAPPPLVQFHFDPLIDGLKKIYTRPAHEFAGTTHTASDLEAIGNFLLYLASLKKKAAA